MNKSELIEAVEKRRLIEFTDEWLNVRTVEAHACVRLKDGRTALIGFQVDIGHGQPQEQLWKLLDDPVRMHAVHGRNYATKRTIPERYIEQVLEVYAQA